MIKLDPKSIEETLYLPEPVKILKIKDFTEQERFFKLEILSGKNLNHQPGQFVQVSVLGIGEAPISVSSSPSADNTFDLCIRAVGDVTDKLHTLKVGDIFHIRGPFGHGFDDRIQKRLKGKHVVFVSGGIGYVPLRSLINKVIPEKEEYEKISILAGWRNRHVRMYEDELAKIAKIGKNVTLLETVDRNEDGQWQENVGVITTLIPKIKMNPVNTVVIICGPPIMYKFVLMSLMDANIPKENIYMSLERRMKCGVGKCGHCQMGNTYVCQTGPVYQYSEVENNPEVF